MYYAQSILCPITVISVSFHFVDMTLHIVQGQQFWYQSKDVCEFLLDNRVL